MTRVSTSAVRQQVGVGLRLVACVAVGFALGVWPSPASALAPGDFDSSFGSSGKVMAQLGAGASPYADAFAVALQPDGKIVEAGGATDSSGYGEMTVVRFTADGGFDPAFGSAGKAVMQLGVGASPGSGAAAVVVQPDGKIVVAGWASDSSGRAQFMVARLNADGSFDTGFGSAGAVVAQLGGSASPSSRANSLAVQPDGKIVAAGYGTDSAGNNQFMVVRLNTSGGFDPSFGSAGTMIAQLGASANPRSAAFALALQLDGKIVVAGAVNSGAGYDQLMVVRLNADGNFDSSFGSTGKVITQLGAGAIPTSFAGAVALEPDGKILTGGVASDSVGHIQFMVARLNADGTLDPSFGAAGKAIVQLGAGTNPSSYARGLALQPDSKIIVAGWASDNAGNDLSTLVRLNANGSLDVGFGSAGKVLVQLGAGARPNSHAYAAALQPDGKIVAAGWASDSAGKDALLAVRLIADLPPTASFSVAPNPAETGKSVAFNGSASSDPGGAIVSYSWSFGDGASGGGPIASHGYAAPGAYSVTLTVRDSWGFSASQTQTITVTTPPPVITKLVLIGSPTPSSTSVGFSLSCQAAIGGICRGAAQLTTLAKRLADKILALSAKRTKPHGKRVTIGATSFTLLAGRSKKIVVPLNSTGRKLLRRFQRIPATIKITLLNNNPHTVLTTKTTIKAKHPRARVLRQRGAGAATLSSSNAAAIVSAPRSLSSDGR